MPLNLVGGIVMREMNNIKSKENNQDNIEEDPYAECNALLSDIIFNYQTVISFGQYNIEQIVQTYKNMLNVHNGVKLRNAIITGFAYGYS